MEVQRNQRIPNYHSVPNSHVLAFLVGIFVICASFLALLIVFVVLTVTSEWDDKISKAATQFHHHKQDEENLEENFNYRGKRQANYFENNLGTFPQVEVQDKLSEIEFKLNLLEHKLSESVVQAERNHDLEVSKNNNNVRGVLLLVAAAEGNLDQVLVLIKLKTNVNFQDEDGNQALHQAVRYSKDEVIKELVLNGATIDAPGNANFTALHWAAQLGCMKCAMCLLDYGADVERRDNWRETPLHKAASEGHVEILKLLLANGARVDTTNFDKFSPLHLATEKGHCHCVQLLLENGANANAMNSYGYTPLHLAAKNGYPDCAVMLLKVSGDVNSRTNGGNTALHLATGYHRSTLVNLLMKYSPRIDARNKQGKTSTQCVSPKDL